MAAAARDLDAELELALDPVAFARAVGVDPDPPQSHVLRSSAPRILLNCTRQFGKSTVAALKGAHRALYLPNRLVLCVSPTDRQSAELFEKISHFVRRAPYAPKRVEDNKRSMRLSNGSRVVSLPGSADTIRGYSGPHLVIVDEAAFCEDALFGAVGPMLVVSRGDLVMLSTPYGKRGQFYEAWENGGDDFERISVPASQCARITGETLERERRTMPDWLFRQEYGCEFVETLDAVFTHAQVSGALCDAPALFDEVTP